MESSQIPPLTLPSGGTVEFVDLDDLTGADLQALRRAIKSDDSAGQTTNVVYEAAMRMAIKTWDIPYFRESDPRTPEANPSAARKLKFRDLRAIEVALQPLLDLINPTPKADDGEPGSPPQPDSE